MKLALCFIIVIISAYIGRLMSRKMAQRLDFFREYLSAMTQLSDKVVGPGLELYKALSDCRSQVIKPIFSRCAMLLRQYPQHKLEKIWSESLVQNRDALSSLSKTDVLFLKEGGNALEALCTNPSEKQAAIHLKRLAEYISALEQESSKKSKLYNTAGVLAGLMIALLVI